MLRTGIHRVSLLDCLWGAYRLDSIHGRRHWTTRSWKGRLHRLLFWTFVPWFSQTWERRRLIVVSNDLKWEVVDKRAAPEEARASLTCSAIWEGSLQMTKNLFPSESDHLHRHRLLLSASLWMFPYFAFAYLSCSFGKWDVGFQWSLDLRFFHSPHDRNESSFGRW